MDGSRLLTTIGLIRQARPGGFCPACRVLMKARDAGQELARPLLAALVVLAVAGVAWVAVVQHSRAMAEAAGGMVHQGWTVEQALESMAAARGTGMDRLARCV